MAEYGPRVGRVSAECWWLIDRASANIRVGREVTDACRSTIGRYVDQHSADIADRYSADRC